MRISRKKFRTFFEIFVSRPTMSYELMRFVSKPTMSPYALEKTGTHHTDTQWKAEAGDRTTNTAKRCTHNATSSRHTDK